MRARLAWVFAAALGCTVVAFAQTPTRSQATGPTTQELRAAVERAEAAAQTAGLARDEAQKQRDETLKKLETASAEMIARATFLQTIATIIVSFVASAVTVGGVLGSVAAVLVGFNLGQSLKKVRQGEAAAIAAVAKIEEMRGGVERHRLFLNNLQQQVTAAVTEIEDKLQAALTPGTGLIGVDLASAVPQRSYDDDALIVFSDRLRMTGDELRPERLATFLVLLGSYWRRWKEYGRAVERIRRAIDLDPSSASAHKALGRAIWNNVAEALAVRNAPISTDESKALEEAEAALGRAQELLSRLGQHDEEILFDLGTISRLKGDAEQAFRHYRQGAALSKALARVQGREPDWDFEFAIACLFASTGRYSEALHELKHLMGKTESWSQERRRAEPRNYADWARSDPDFSTMLGDPKWKKELARLSPAAPD